MEIIIRKLGNSKGVIIPAEILEGLNWDINDIIDVRAENGRLILERTNRREYSIHELLAQCGPEVRNLDEEDKEWLNS